MSFSLVGGKRKSRRSKLQKKHTKRVRRSRRGGNVLTRQVGKAALPGLLLLANTLSKPSYRKHSKSRRVRRRRR